MINDFVTGKLGNENAEAIIPDLKAFLREVKKSNMPRIFVQDSHEEDDPELSHWGEHAMKRKEESETIPELEGLSSQKLNKRFYDAFHKTKLQNVLEKNDIDEVVLTGVATNICVQNTAAGAFYRGFKIVVLSDCTAAASIEDHENALDYMENIFGAEVIASGEMIERL